MRPPCSSYWKRPEYRRRSREAKALADYGISLRAMELPWNYAAGFIAELDEAEDEGVGE